MCFSQLIEDLAVGWRAERWLPLQIEYIVGTMEETEG